jgi:transcriptional regulator with XRE-family HTH domain
MITEFGKELRKIRVDHGEVLRDMATRLNVSASFISAVESGKKKIPDAWLEKIPSLYALSAPQAQQLRQAAQWSSRDVKLDLTKASPCQRDAALVFARDFEKLSDETAQQILKLLHQYNTTKNKRS